MDIMLKTSAGVLVATVLCLLLSKSGKEHALLVSIAVCCLVSIAAFEYLKPVLTFLDRISQTGNLNSESVKILFKAVGISLLAEFTALLCADSGNAAMSRLVQIFASAVILWLSIPLFNNLLDLVSELLEKT